MDMLTFVLVALVNLLILYVLSKFEIDELIR